MPSGARSRLGEVEQPKHDAHEHSTKRLFRYRTLCSRDPRVHARPGGRQL